MSRRILSRSCTPEFPSGFSSGSGEPQARDAKRKESLRAKLPEILTPCQKPQNLDLVSVDVKNAHFKPQDADIFAKEFSEIISDIDKKLRQQPPIQNPDYELNFSKHPVVGKYVQTLQFWSHDSQTRRIINEALSRAAADPDIPWEKFAREAKAPMEDTRLAPSHEQQTGSWLEFPSDGGAYSSDSALEALRDIVQKKTKKYAPQLTRDIRLIIHYSEAVLYNTPYEDQKYKTFADVACEAQLGSDPKPFTKVYLLRALRPNPEVFEIWPAFYRLPR